MEQTNGLLAKHISAFRQNHSRRMAQQNGEGLGLFFSAQLNDDLHGTFLADMLFWRNAAIEN
jgi:hypothetical protein